MKKIIANIIAASSVVLGVLAGGMTASATTVDDVAAEARKWGYPESTIQDGYNYYLQDPDAYTEEDFEVAINELRRAGTNLITTAPKDDTPVQTTATTAVSSKVTTTKNQSKPDAQIEPDNGGDEIILTMPDGTKFSRISTADFIKLTYDQKMAYLRTFEPEQQQVIIDNLTPEEYRSLLKQLPSEQKLEVVSDLSEAVEAMGMHLTVEEVSDESLSVAMRNDEGELISVSNAGMIVEDTGYDRRGIFAASGVLFLAAAVGALAVIRRSFKKDETGETNEQ